MEPPTVEPRSRGGTRALDAVTGTVALVLLLPACLGFVVASTALLTPLVPGEPSGLAPPTAALLAIASLPVVAMCWCRVARSLATAVWAVAYPPVTEPVTVPAPRSGEVSAGARIGARR